MTGFEWSPRLHPEKEMPQQSEKTTATAIMLGIETAAQCYFAACRAAAAGLAALPKIKNNLPRTGTTELRMK